MQPLNQVSYLLYSGNGSFCMFNIIVIYCIHFQVDSYGTQQPIALLKLLLDRGGLYDRAKELNYKNLKDLGFMAAMGKAGGGRNEVDPRFTSLFSVFSIPFPSLESLHLIYASILKGHTRVSIYLSHKLHTFANVNDSYCSELINMMNYFSYLKMPYRRFVIKSPSALWGCTTPSSKKCHPLPPSFTISSI